MRAAGVAVLVVFLVGCGGSSGGSPADPSGDFRATVHTAYDGIESTVVETPTAHPGLALREWATFRNQVAKASAPDSLVAVKSQLLRDVGTLLAHLHATTGIDYTAISAAQSQADTDLAAIKGDVAGL